ncbi:Ig-like domain-containing protein [Wukongibacter baidiensis]|uniref:Ig-like domain-containing protein n=1 Tax=Wukongibacter baidiensis TaxID=1723361 RepID=UPI003D7F3D55
MTSRLTRKVTYLLLIIVLSILNINIDVYAMDNIINNGETNISVDGSYEFADDYSGTIIIGKSVTMVTLTSNLPLNDTNIVFEGGRTGPVELTIDNLDITAPEGAHGIDFGLAGPYEHRLYIRGVCRIIGDLADFSNGNRTSGAGIRVNSGTALTIDKAMGLTNDEAKLTVESGHTHAAIGGSGGEDGGKITLDGGTLFVKSSGSSGGAGIGGGHYGAGGTILINGGIITAEGDGGAAAIGGGENGSGGLITITGGDINATSIEYGAGIGGGSEGDAGIIKISGGNVIATGQFTGSGIGSGTGATTVGEITISGGEVIATGINGSAGIGGGEYSGGGKILINGGNITATGGSYGAGIGSGSEGASTTITITDGTVEAIGGSYGAGIGSGGEAIYGAEVEISGGDIRATGGKRGAGVGSGYKVTDDGEIKISGGNITATGGSYGAGIGSGYTSSGEVITIENQPVIIATGGKDADNIGNGKDVTSPTQKKDTSGNILSYVSFNITDGSNPITDAIVTIAGSNYETNNEGQIGLFVALGSDLTYEVSAQDYETSSDMNNVNEENYDIIVVMTKEVRPKVIGLSPQDNSTSVIPEVDLTMTFDKNINLGTGYITIYKGSDDSEVEKINITDSNVVSNEKIVTIDPRSRLSANTKYYIEIDESAIYDDQNIYFKGIDDKETWNFETIGLPDDNNLISSGDTIINLDGIYVIEDGYSGTITVASNVTEVKVTGSASLTDTSIVIDSGRTDAIELTLENIDITAPNGSPGIDFGSAGNYDNKLYISGQCIINASSDNAGIRVSSGAALIIDNVLGLTDTEAKLTVLGGWNAAGIGGNNGEDAGTITISGGTLISTGGNNGAGIGGGYRGSGGSIIVSNNPIILATADEINMYIGNGKDSNGTATIYKDTIGGDELSYHRFLVKDEFHNVLQGAIVNVDGTDYLSNSDGETGCFIELGKDYDLEISSVGYYSSNSSDTANSQNSLHSVLLSEDKDAPYPSDKSISTGNIKTDKVSLSWQKADDHLGTEQSELMYEIYYSKNSQLDTISGIRAYGILYSRAADTNRISVDGLSQGTKYFFNIVVKDKAGNESCYEAASATTSVYIPPYVPSTNAYLRNLSIKGLELNPSFDRYTYDYKVSVPNETKTIELSASVENYKSSMKINGVYVPDYTTKAIALNTGVNVITINIAAENRYYQKTYIVTVNRKYEQEENIEEADDINELKEIRSSILGLNDESEREVLLQRLTDKSLELMDDLSEIDFIQSTIEYITDDEKREVYQIRLDGKEMIFNGKYSNWDEHKEIPQQKDKVWNIKFNFDLDEETIVAGDDYITIVDEDGYRIEIELEYEKRIKQLKIKPLKEYIQGKRYYIILGGKVRSIHGTDLNKPLRVEFFIED